MDLCIAKSWLTRIHACSDVKNCLLENHLVVLAAPRPPSPGNCHPVDFLAIASQPSSHGVIKRHCCISISVLQGAPFGFTPFCDNNKDMEGFRFWKQGFWKEHLRGKPYHISALFVVDLARFRFAISHCLSLLLSLFLQVSMPVPLLLCLSVAATYSSSLPCHACCWLLLLGCPDRRYPLNSDTDLRDCCNVQPPKHPPPPPLCLICFTLLCCYCLLLAVASAS